MKNRGSKTHAPQADPQEIRAIIEGLKRLPAPQFPFNFRERGKTAEEAKRLYDAAQHLHRSFPWNEDADQAYEAARERYREAVLAAYPKGFAEDLKRLRRNDPAGLPQIIAFLEADPIVYATGYLKEDLARWIKPEMLTRQHAVRLRRIVLNIVDKRHQRDFNSFCNIARKVDAPELRQELTERLDAADPAIRRRARWMLEAMDAGRRKKREVI